MTCAPDSVGRLLCVGVRGSEPGETTLESDLDACAWAGVGAVILFDVDVPEMTRLREGGLTSEEAARRATRNVRSPEQLRCLTSYIRSRLGEDALICVDQEGGSTSRLTRERGFQAGVDAQSFAALTESDRRNEAETQASQLADAGVDVNLAPCVDLALEPESSIIARLGRSFGDDPEVVIACAREIIASHHSRRLGTCLKHFPGHGSARGDSHKGLVDITATARPEVELTPYREILRDAPGSVAVMVAHVMDRRIDPDHPATLSPRFIDGLLRGDLGFAGLVLTDSIDMAAIANTCKPGEAAVRAICAGADVVIDGFNLDPARVEHPAQAVVSAIRDAVKVGRISSERIEQSLARLDAFRHALARPFAGRQAP